MGSFAVAAKIVSTVINAGVGIQKARSQRSEGKVQESEFKRAAEMEKISAVERERIRRRELNQILGTKIAEIGARGIKSEGSPAAAAKGLIEQSALDEAGTKISDLSRISQLKRAGTGARRMGKNASEGTLLKTFGSTLKQAADI
jgi:hypothetical protein|tara:strand:+ start:76 stop:510 length:435 start_codon:yes stop_codon:yes gene_type:complete